MTWLLLFSLIACSDEDKLSSRRDVEEENSIEGISNHSNADKVILSITWEVKVVTQKLYLFGLEEALSWRISWAVMT